MEYSDEEMKSLMIDHIEGKLNGELKEYVEKHIQKNPDSKKEYDQLKEVLDIIDTTTEFEPNPDSVNHFQKFIEQEKSEAAAKNEAGVVQIPLNWVYRAAAAIAFVVIGIGIGSQLGGSNDEIAQLRSEMEETKALIMMNMQEETSASQRIQGVLASNTVEIDAELTNALVERMNEDPNVNVRIAAVEALANYIEIEEVKTSLIQALETQDKPLVQIRLIHLMVEMDIKQAITPLENLSTDQNILDTVQDEAQMGVYKLM